MTRTRHLAVVFALAAALAGCSSDGEPSAAPSSPTAASSSATPSPQADGREACRETAELTNSNEFDAALNRAAGTRAMAAADPGIAAAGEKLVSAADDAEVEPGPAANIEVGLAQLDVAAACREAFGEGPW